MKFVRVAFMLCFFSTLKAQTVADTVVYEYKMFTTIESLIPAKLGRSRMISTDKNSQLQEKELQNFFSPVGINFKNIQNNDVIIVNKMNELALEGFTYYQSICGVYSNSKEDKLVTSPGNGLFITRYIFRRPIKK